MSELDLAIRREELERLLFSGRLSQKEGRELAKIRRTIDDLERLKEDV